MKKCPHCGEKNFNDADVCVKCQCEILDIKPGNHKRKKQRMSSDQLIGLTAILILLCIISVCVALFVAPFPFVLVLVFVFTYSVCVCISRLKAIAKENGCVPSAENIEYCPVCNSRNIKIYREGYNYNKGFWLRAFGVKGGGYVAGMNSNRARCRCMTCGYDWATDYDYRLIDKK